MATTKFLADNKTPFVLKNEPFQGSYGNGLEGFFRLPVGPTYHRLLFHFTDGGVDVSEQVLRDDVKKLIVLVDGDEKISFTGRELIYMAKLRELAMTGRVDTVANGRVVLHLNAGWFEDVDNRESSAYGMSANSSFQVRIEWNDSGVTVDKVSLFRETTVGASLGRHITFRSVTEPVSGTGARVISTLPRDPLADLLALHISGVDGDDLDLGAIKLLADNTAYIDVDDPADLFTLDRLHGHDNMNDGAIITLDFTRKGLFREAMKMTMQDLRLDITFNTAQDVRIIQERSEVQQSAA